MPYGTVNTDIVADSSGGKLAPISSVFRNRIINGAMVIDQRNAGASVTVTTANEYTIDRWQTFSSVSSKYSVQQNAGSVTPPVGFINYLGVTSLAATSVGASDFYGVTQKIEGLNVFDLGWGSANAKTVTLSFWVRSSLTGTFGGVFQNASGNRSYPFTYTISSANTWTQISVTVAGDTSGTWATNNTVGINVFFGLGMGSTYSGTAGAWAGATYYSATGATSVVGTSGATLYITGVQLEVGSSATGFEYVNYQTSLANCQRYLPAFSTSGAVGSYAWVCNGYCASTTVAYGLAIPFPVTPRTPPTGATITNGTSSFNITLYGAAVTLTGLTYMGGTLNAGGLYGTVASGLTNGQGLALQATNSNGLILFTGCEL
jgi:hypothetical protein